jgi:hypothetical protein
MPSLLPEEEFEDRYTNRFRDRLGGRGIILKYERDRAATDLGIHLTPPGSLTLSNVRVWFQLKGIHAATLARADIQNTESVSVRLNLEHLRFWYAAPEAVYLIVYLEAIDEFLAADVRDLVDDQWGEAFLRPDFFPTDQKTAVVHVPSSARLTDELLNNMLAHQSMRIDGPSFRGRPLGHRLDPLRSQLDVLDPQEFELLVTDLLNACRYRVEHTLDAGYLLGGICAGTDRATLTTGILYNTWEWVFQLGTEFGFGPGTDFRVEGQTFQAHGRVGVLIHSSVSGDFSEGPKAAAVREQLQQADITQLLIFLNTQSAGAIGAYRRIAGELYTIPQDLGSLAYNTLIATLVYLRHRDRLRWKLVNYQI